MTTGADGPGRPPRALLLGPAYAAADIKGGMPLALSAVVEQLEARGWQIDAQIWAAAAPSAGRRPPARAWASTEAPRRPSLLDRHLALFDIWTWAFPNSLRRLISLWLRPEAYCENLAHNLRLAEGVLAKAQAYDVVLLSLDEATPGLGALVTAQFEHVAIISLSNLAEELSAGNNRWLRWVARWRLGRHMHPYLFRSMAPGQVRLALFASNLWREQALQAGLPAARARTIYFGVPQPPALARPAAGGHRILFVGRLSRDKGAHLLLRALPLIQAHVPDTTVTMIAGPGPTGYRRLLAAMSRAAHLDQAVSILPALPRPALQAAYAAHDVLFFYSIYAEPVALVLMEAFAAGLPVAASQARSASALVRDGHTCLCYDPKSAQSLARVMLALLTDCDLQARLAASAQQLVRKDFTLDKMGQVYDAVLREFVAVHEHAPAT